MDAKQRLAKLEEKRDQLTARIVRLRNVEAARQRKLRTRRLILMGSYMDHEITRSPEAHARLRRKLDRFLTRPRDRALFQLPDNPVED
jgi:hypothetical protein